MKVLKFYASWCYPCLALGAVIAQSNSSVEVQEIDIDKDPKIVQEYKVRGVPTLVLLDDEGKEVKRHTGPMTTTTYEQFVAIQAVDTD